MPKPKYFVDKQLDNVLLDEFLAERLRSAGYGGVEVEKTPVGTKLSIRALRAGLVIGRRGSRIKETTKVIEEEFDYPNPTISVEEVEDPELEPRIMAWQAAKSLARGYKYRRVGFWVLRSIMEAGPAGAEVEMKGKLRVFRSYYEKFSDGVLLKSGELAERLVDEAKTDVHLKQGTVGIKVRIAPATEEYMQAIGQRAAEVEEEEVAEPEEAEPEEEKEKVEVSVEEGE